MVYMGITISMHEVEVCLSCLCVYVCVCMCVYVCVCVCVCCVHVCAHVRLTYYVFGNPCDYAAVHTHCRRSGISKPSCKGDVCENDM